MKLLSTLSYYSSSVVTLVRNIRNWYAAPVLFAKRPARFYLKNGMVFDLEAPMDLWTLKEVMFDRCYEQFFPFKKNWTIIDVGAEFGDFSVMNSFTAKRVISCEINPSAVKRLKHHISLNKAPNITVEPKGAHSLKELFEKYKITTCDLLKMDCEGCEYPLIFSASPAILKKVKRIVMEYHVFDEAMRSQFQKFVAVLKKAGYKVTYVESPVHTKFGFLAAQRELFISSVPKTRSDQEASTHRRRPSRTEAFSSS